MVYHPYMYQAPYSPYSTDRPLMSQFSNVAPQAPDTTKINETTDFVEGAMAESEGHLLPLDFSLLYSLYAGINTSMRLSFKEVAEMECVCQVASRTRAINQKQFEQLKSIQKALWKRLGMLHSSPDHSRIYGERMSTLYTMIYDTEKMTPLTWQAFARCLDDAANDFYPGEYNELAGILNDHTIEIENAVYIHRGRPELCSPDPLKVNYVSYSSLMTEAQTLHHDDEWSEKYAKNLVAVKARQAARMQYITSDQFEAIIPFLDLEQF